MKILKTIITIILVGWVAYWLSTLFVTLNLLWLSLALLVYSIIVYTMGRHDLIFQLKAYLTTLYDRMARRFDGVH